jgi:hypothetical protein
MSTSSSEKKAESTLRTANALTLFATDQQQPRFRLQILHRAGRRDSFSSLQSFSAGARQARLSPPE